MKKRYFGACLASVLVLLVVGSCHIPTSPDSKASSLKVGTVTIRFPMRNRARTVLPDWNTAITSYSVTMTSHDGFPTLTTTVSNGESASFSSVGVGTWDIGVTALSGATTVGAGSLTGQAIDAGSNLSLTIPVYGTQTGTGNYSFMFSVPASTSIDYVSAQLYGASSMTAIGSAIVPYLSTSGSNLVGTIAQTGIASGAYHLQMTFYRGGSTGTVAGVYGEFVNVWDNVTSDQWLDSSGNLKSQRTFSITDFNSTDASLLNLVVSGGGSALALSPGFSSDVTTYTATSSSSVTITPTESLPGQGIQYQVNGTSGTWTSIGSGLTSSAMTLGSSSTVIYVKVTASDQVTTSTYKVTVSLPETVTLGAQSGMIVSGTAGSASLAATTSNVAAGTAGTVTWYTSADGATTTTAPTGVTASVSAASSNTATVTMTADTTAVAGSYYFTLTESTAVSAVTTFTVDAALTIPRDGLVGEWLFDDNANDTSANGNNGTVWGATFSSDRFNSTSSALRVDGTSGYAQLPYVAIPSGISYSVSLWVNRSGWLSTSNYNAALIWGDMNQPKFSVSYSNNTGNFYFGGWGTDYQTSPTAFTADQWIHVVVVVNSDIANLYINGVNDGMAVSVDSVDKTNFYIGNTLENNEGIYGFDGLIDDIRIYDRALSNSEIVSLYSEGGWTGPREVSLGVNPQLSPAAWQAALRSR